MIQEKEYLEAKRIVTLYECQQLNISGVIKSVCVSCGKPVKDFDEENNNCCDECWLRAQQTVL